MATESLGNMIYRLGFDDGGFSAGMDNVAEKMALVRSEMKASASQFGELGDASDKAPKTGRFVQTVSATRFKNRTVAGKI